MIDKQAVIHPSAKIAEDVYIGPWTVVGENVEIGSGCWVGPHVVISGPTKLGKNNKIYQFASIGEAPQDITYSGEDTTLEIGDDNVIREYVTIHRGTKKGHGTTKIGNKNFFMAYSHIGHDCILGNEIILVSYAALSGHVTVHDYCNIGAYAGIHQFCDIGAYSFVARASYITKDVLPYMMISGHSAQVCGLNSVGIKRRGFTSDEVENLRRAYKIIFRRGLTVQQALVELMELAPECEKIKLLMTSLKSSTRGITR